MKTLLKNCTRIFLIGFLFAAMISCSNPTGPRNSASEEESTGINSNPSNGLVAGIPLDGEGILTNPDVTISDGVTWETGLSGNAMRGDEDGDYIRIAAETIPESTTAGTLEVWIYPDCPEGEDNKWAGILHKGELIDFTDESWSLQYQGTEKIMFNYHYDSNGDNAYKSVIAAQSVSADTWHHIAVSWSYDEASDETVLILYQDGVENNRASFTGLGPMLTSEGDLIVGSQLPEQYSGYYGHLTFMGLIDEIYVYDVVRTAEEIAADYNVYASLF